MYLIIVFAFLSQICYAYNSPHQINNLARENYKLVPYFGNRYMKKYKLNYDERKEMMQEGYVGLMYACRKYDETRGLKFSTYGKFWILRYMKEYVNKKYKYDKILIDIDNIQIPSYDHISELCFDLLNEKEKDIIFKRYFQNMKIIDIADYYGVSRNTMTNWITVSIEKLKKTNNY
jgi:RNA polymerase sigma factor (sigma-70 family)